MLNKKWFTVLLSLLVLSALVLSACAPADDTAGEEGQLEEGLTTPGVGETAGAGMETAVPGAVEGGETPSVTVSDQDASGGSVIVDNVVSSGPGWIVIHADEGGSPGAVLGYAPVVAGANENVEVPLDMGEPTATMYAMLHVDAGAEGTYEFPGDDVPAEVDGEMINVAFSNTAAQ